MDQEDEEMMFPTNHMKQLFLLVAILFLVQCEKQSTEPEIKYYDVKYVVSSSGDTTLVIYRDQNGKDQSCCSFRLYICGWRTCGCHGSG